MEFRKFIPIVKNSNVIITDSGGLALEANFLGIPALIHRQRTENPDGLGTTSMLSKLDVNAFEPFILGRDKFRGPNLVDTHFPSKQIAEFVAENA
jgi:UDP-N-acetylglucosamine 2-epimerase (non-hydrolysing)